jgi:hypothetical protein
LVIFYCSYNYSIVDKSPSMKMTRKEKAQKQKEEKQDEKPEQKIKAKEKHKLVKRKSQISNDDH